MTLSRQGEMMLVLYSKSIGCPTWNAALLLLVFIAVYMVGDGDQGVDSRLHLHSTCLDPAEYNYQEDPSNGPIFETS
jgi:hypothetical protein